MRIRSIETGEETKMAKEPSPGFAGIFAIPAAGEVDVGPVTDDNLEANSDVATEGRIFTEEQIQRIWPTLQRRKGTEEMPTIKVNIYKIRH